MKCTCRWLRDSAAFLTTRRSVMRRLTSAFIVSGIFVACLGIVLNANVSAANGSWASALTRARAWVGTAVPIEGLPRPTTVSRLVSRDLKAVESGAGAVEQQTATVSTDKSDYPPSTQVTVTGSGWQPGETVTLQFAEQPYIDGPHLRYPVADGNGNISDNTFWTDSF